MLKYTEKIASLSLPILYIFILRTGKVTTFEATFSVRNINKYIIRKLWGAIFSVIFNVSKPKLCNVTNFKMLFRAVGKDFVLLA